MAFIFYARKHIILPKVSSLSDAKELYFITFQKTFTTSFNTDVLHVQAETLYMDWSRNNVSWDFHMSRTLHQTIDNGLGKVGRYFFSSLDY